jgi:NodT family efflux transporter outer membrane factor (OMF) lipoprotein
MCRCVKNLHRSGVGFALVLLAAIFAAGCAGLKTPPPVTDPTVPDAWQESPRGPSAAQGPTAEELAVWWRQLGDWVLDELVGRTIAGNIELETAAARVEEARARRGVAQSERGPSVSASWGSGRSEALGDQVAPNDSFSASLQVSWEADVFKAKRLSVAASQADLESEEENLRAVQVSLVAETVVAYTDLRVAEARLGVLDENLSSREETFQLTRWREQAGLASRLEANQARSSLGEARAGRPAFEQLATDARLRLNLLAGESPGALDELLATPTLDFAIPIPPDAVFAGIPAETLRQRPDVRSAERQIEAAWARLGVAKAARYPSFGLTGSLDARSTDVADIFNANSVIANLVSGLTAPIFESGRIRENIAIREAQYEQAALAYQSTVLEALSEVEQALSAYRSSQERIAELEEAVRSATEAAELADQRYAAGLVDLLPVLDTQRTLFSLEDQLVNARGERSRAFSDLYRALGGGWDFGSVEPVTDGGSNA